MDQVYSAGTWVLSVVVAGVAVNLLSHYIRGPLERVFQNRMMVVSQREESKKLAHQEKVLLLSSSLIHSLYAMWDAVVSLLGSLMLLVVLVFAWQLYGSTAIETIQRLVAVADPPITIFGAMASVFFVGLWVLFGITALVLFANFSRFVTLFFEVRMALERSAAAPVLDVDASDANGLTGN